MSKRFIISEQERTQILGLYEKAPINTTETTIDENSVNIGYLVKLDQAGTGKKSPEELQSLKNARIYFENLRDGIKPKPLTPADRFVVNYSLEQTKDLPYEEKLELEKLGKGIKSV